MKIIFKNEKELAHITLLTYDIDSIIKNNDEFSSNMYINDCFYNQYFRFGFSDLLVKKNVYGKFIDGKMTILSIFIDVNFYYNEGFKIDTIPSIKDNHIISLNPDYEF